MQLFVSLPTGQTRSLIVSSKSDTISSLLAELSVSDSDVSVSYAGKQLDASKSISEYPEISNDSTLKVLGMLKGGHCQVPCGIFDDPKLVAEVKEAVATITKASKETNRLFGEMKTPLAFNQMTRWVNTKEEHANKIIHLMGDYCLCQRVKPFGSAKSPFKSEKDYVDALKAHHAVMIAAMKSKQSTDASAASALAHAVDDWCKMYLSE
eukprot:g4154.t1